MVILGLDQSGCQKRTYWIQEKTDIIILYMIFFENAAATKELVVNSQELLSS